MHRCTLIHSHTNLVMFAFILVWCMLVHAITCFLLSCMKEKSTIWDRYIASASMLRVCSSHHWPMPIIGFERVFAGLVLASDSPVQSLIELISRFLDPPVQTRCPGNACIWSRHVVSHRLKRQDGAGATLALPQQGKRRVVMQVREERCTGVWMQPSCVSVEQKQ